MDEDKQIQFVRAIARYPIILQKSQLPLVKQKKKMAVEEVAQLLGIEKVDDVLKKFNNMKTRLKTYMDANQTGNKKIVLKGWQKELAELLNYEINPSISSLPGGIEVGVGQNAESESSNESPVVDFDSDIEPTDSPIDPRPGTSTSVAPVRVEAKKRKLQDPLEKYETEETKKLSNSQLQRLLMLEQLNLVRRQIRKDERELGWESDQY